MNMKIKELNGVTIAVVDSKRHLISDVQTALDFIMSIQYETGCNRVAINKEAVTYTSKSLRDFMHESNKGKDIFFSLL